MQFKRHVFLSTPIDNCDESMVLSLLEKMAASKQFNYVVTPNVDHVLRIHADRSLQQIYHKAALSLCDSQIVRALMKIKGYEAIAINRGSDLTKTVLTDLDHSGNVVSLIGGKPEDTEMLKHKYGVGGVWHYEPPFGFARSPQQLAECCEFIESHPAPYIFFALGSPQQEILANELAKRGKASGVALCIGASIDFLAGRQVRAPKFMSDIGLEWLHRMLTQPRRLVPRYAANANIFLRVLFAEDQRGKTTVRGLSE